MPTPHDIIDQASISGVWLGLGGRPLRHGRGVAWWRNGDGYSIALDETKGCWFDHAQGEGGGILDLIQAVFGCDRKESLRWLADHQGVTLDDRPLTREEKRRYAQRRTRAESAACDLTEWRRRVLRESRDERNRLFSSEQIVSAVARTLLTTECDGDDDEAAWSEIWRCALDHLEADAIDREIQRLESAAPAELVKIRQAAA